MDAALSWKQYIDEATGKPYYFNEISKRTQWNRPDSDKIQIVEYFTDTDQGIVRLEGSISKVFELLL